MTEPDVVIVPAPRFDRLRVFVVSTASRSFFGRAIRFLTGFPVSHSLMLWRIPGAKFDDPWVVAEARSSGFYQVDVRREEAAQTWIRAHEILLEDAALWRIVNRLKKISGVPYDWATIRGYILPSLVNRVTRRTGVNRLRPRRRDDRKLYCSEALQRVLREEGLRGLDDVEVSPGELDECLSQSPDATACELPDLLALIAPTIESTTSAAV